MSISRFSKDSDVYLFDDVAGGITCCACKLMPKVEHWPYVHKSSHFSTVEFARQHALKHQTAHHKVPVEVFEYLNDLRDDDLDPLSDLF